jgi:xylose dehydrogenase (NAD/NADP)
MNLLHWGVLGTARISRKLIPAIAGTKGHCVHAIASRFLEKAQAEALTYAIPRAYAGYETLLADPEIDIVYIPLPNALHAQWTLAAINAGKHVLCEKPMAISLQEADKVAEAAHAAGVIVSEAFMYRHHPALWKVRELIRENTIGRVRLIRGTFRFMLNRSADARFDPALGGGSLWDVGCYPVSYARFLLENEPLEAFGWADMGSSGVDETFAGQLRFPEEVFLQFDCSFRAPYKAEMEIVGSTGTIRVAQPFKPGLVCTVELTRDTQAVEIIEVDGGREYSGAIQNMADAILDTSAARVTLQDSRGNCAVLLALLASARDGRPITICK